MRKRYTKNFREDLQIDQLIDELIVNCTHSSLQMVIVESYEDILWFIAILCSFCR